MKRSEVFKQRAIHRFGWFAQGAGLIRAAYVLWSEAEGRLQKHMQIPSPLDEDTTVDVLTDYLASASTHLAGLGIENVVKGLIMSRLTLPANVQRLPKEVDHHNLKKLFATAGIGLNADEQLLIERLEEAVRWKGRYSTPLCANDIDRTNPLMSYPTSYHHPEEIRDIFVRVVREYPPEVWGPAGGMPRNFPDSVDKWLKYVIEECPATTAHHAQDKETP